MSAYYRSEKTSNFLKELEEEYTQNRIRKGEIILSYSRDESERILWEMIRPK